MKRKQKITITEEDIAKINENYGKFLDTFLKVVDKLEGDEFDKTVEGFMAFMDAGFKLKRDEVTD